QHLGISACPLDTQASGPIAEVNSAEWKKLGCRVSSFLRERITTCGLGRIVAELAKVLTPLCNEREAERLDRVCELGWTVGTVSRVDSFIELIRSKKREFSRPAAVQALTIHKSKGLEFDVVVLPDLFEEFFDMKTNAYVGRDPDSLDVDTVLVSVNKDLQYLLPSSPVDFKRLIQNQWQTDMEEALCNLYVAITRAKYQLSMIVPPQKDDKYTSRTYANIVRAGLGVMTGNQGTQPEIAYSHGDSLWWKQTSFTPKTTQLDTALTPTSEVLTNIASGVTPVARNLYLSPSQDASLKWSNPLSYIRGTALHRCFQEIQWLDRDGLPNDDFLIDALEQLPGPKVDPAMIIAEFKMQCQKQEIREALSLGPLQNASSNSTSPVSCTKATNTPQWEVYAERPFSFTRRDGHLARGVIDRLVLLRDRGRIIGAEIIDYKSDRLEDFDSHGKITEKNTLLFEKYFGQLREYEKVVRRWYHLRPEMIAKKLLFVSSGIVVPVPAAVEI
ncbi:MAG: 3'-5' exonuclease, partial [Planctomycetia bacterium]|nr:3'-5' exonuclease [Planctomycetia bacterium]